MTEKYPRSMIQASLDNREKKKRKEGKIRLDWNQPFFVYAISLKIAALFRSVISDCIFGFCYRFSVPFAMRLGKSIYIIQASHFQSCKHDSLKINTIKSRFFLLLSSHRIVNMSSLTFHVPNTQTRAKNQRSQHS